MSRLAVATLLVCLVSPTLFAQEGMVGSAPTSSAAYVSNPKSGPPSDTHPVDGPEKGSNEWQVWTADSVPFSPFQDAPLARIWAAGGTYGRVLTDPRGPAFLRGRFEVGFEVDPLMKIDLPHHSVYAPGFAPVLLKWDFVTRHRVSPYFELSGGAVFGNHDVVPGTSSFNFMPSVAVGANFPAGRSGKYSWTADVRFFHISNAGLTDYNPGLNTVQFRIGFGFFSHPKR